MHIIKKLMASMLAAAICCFTMAGCTDNSSNISYGNIVCDTLNPIVMDAGIKTKLDSKDSNIYTDIFKDYEDAAAKLADLGVSENMLSAYDEGFFADNDLFAVAFGANSDYEYTVKRINLEGSTLNVLIDEKISSTYHLMLVYRIIFIELPKDELPDDVSANVQFNEVEY